ncbi:hypothetical protein NLJ89_g6952 [Agrocybe chaxingu]|uniref:Uncharacterized protein n=1 Tax=Agrocybe chaxingu TaxID=84603 RepID=A0A9W8MS70_9AGAR|nr:hypothetical protein NLJ89_g6952 [Agrocybe chaxingu]
MTPSTSETAGSHPNQDSYSVNGGYAMTHASAVKLLAHIRKKSISNFTALEMQSAIQLIHTHFEDNHLGWTFWPIDDKLEGSRGMLISQTQPRKGPPGMTAADTSPLEPNEDDEEALKFLLARGLS